MSAPSREQAEVWLADAQQWPDDADRQKIVALAEDWLRKEEAIRAALKSIMGGTRRDAFVALDAVLAPDADTAVVAASPAEGEK